MATQATLDLIMNLKGAGDVSSDLEKVGGSAEGLGNRMTQAKTRGDGFFGGLLGGAAKVGLATTGIGLFAGAATDLIGGMVAGNAEMESYATQFEVLTGSVENAGKMMDDLKVMGAKTPFEFTDLAAGTQTLLAFGRAQSDIIPELSMLGDISGGNAEKMKSLSLVFGQVASNGKLMGGDLLQMINVGFNPLQIMADKTGKSMGELRADMEKGNISFDMVKDAMKTATSEGGQFFGMMDKQSGTFSGLASTFQDTLGSLQRTAMQPIFDVAKQGLETFITILSSPEVMSGVQSVATLLADGLGAAFRLVGDVIGFVTPIIQNLITFVQGLLAPLQQTGESTSQLGATLNAVWAAVQAVVMPILQIIFAELSKFWTEIQPQLQAVWASIQGLIEAAMPIIMNVIGGALTFIMNLFTTVWPGIQQIVEGVWTVIQGVISAAMAIIQGVISTVTALIKGDWEGAWEAIKTMLSGVWDGIKGIIQGAIDVVKGIIDVAIGVIKTVWETFWGNIKGFVEGIWNGITTAIRVKWEEIKALWAAAQVIVKAYWDQFWGNIKSFFENIWNGVTTTIQTKWNEIKALWAAAQVVVKTIWDQFWENLKTTLSTAWENIKTAVSTAIETVRTTIVNKFNEVTTFIGSLPGLFMTKATEIGTGLIDGIISGLAGLGQKMLDTIKNLIGGAIDGVKQFFGIQSPSDETEQEIGQPLGAGTMLGWEAGVNDNKQAVLDAMTGVLGEVKLLVMQAFKDDVPDNIRGYWDEGLDGMYRHLFNAFAPNTLANVGVFFDNLTGIFQGYMNDLVTIWFEAWQRMTLPELPQLPPLPGAPPGTPPGTPPDERGHRPPTTPGGGGDGGQTLFGAARVGGGGGDGYAGMQPITVIAYFGDVPVTPQSVRVHQQQAGLRDRRRNPVQAGGQGRRR